MKLMNEGEHSRSILVIDDDQVDRMRIKKMLLTSDELKPVEVHEAKDLTSGLNAINAENYDCLVLDFSLPDGDALSFLEKLKTNPDIRLPVIIQTVHNDRRLGLSTVEAGAQDYLVKGRFDAGLLEKTILYSIERFKLFQEKEALIVKLKVALERIETFEGIFPICSMCRKIRDKDGVWQRLENYIMNHTKAKPSHGMCDNCLEKFIEEEIPAPEDNTKKK